MSDIHLKYEWRKTEMKTFQVEVTVSADRRLTIELPEDVAAGSYQIVGVMNPTSESQPKAQTRHGLNALAGQVQSFASANAIAWQQQERAS